MNTSEIVRSYNLLSPLQSSGVDPFFGLGGGAKFEKCQKKSQYQTFRAYRAAKITIVYV